MELSFTFCISEPNLATKLLTASLRFTQQMVLIT